jgi:hypothetical protein
MPAPSTPPSAEAPAAVTLDDCMAVSPARAPDVLEINEALERLAEVD